MMKSILCMAQSLIVLFSCQIYYAADFLPHNNLSNLDSKSTTEQIAFKKMVTDAQVKMLHQSFMQFSDTFKKLDRPTACRQLTHGIRDAIALCNTYENHGIKYGFETDSSNKILSCKKKLTNLLTSILHPNAPLTEGDFVSTNQLTINSSTVVPENVSICIHYPEGVSPRKTPKSPILTSTSPTPSFSGPLQFSPLSRSNSSTSSTSETHEKILE